MTLAQERIIAERALLIARIGDHSAAKGARDEADALARLASIERREALATAEAAA